MSLFTPNTDNFDNYYDKARFLLAWRISFSFTIVFVILSSVFSFGNDKVLTMSLSTLAVVGASLIYLAVTKNYKPLFWVYAVSGTLLSHVATNYVLDYTHYVDFLWMIASILVAFVGLGKKYGLLFLFLNIIGIAYFFWFTLNTHIQTLQPKTNLEILGDFIEILLAMFVIAYLLFQYMAFNDYSENKLKEANHKLEIQNQLVLTKNAENITLIKEVHHRVKNNLQIIISLLRLQKGELKSDESKRHFSEAINRIMVMSLIHKKLYQQTELAEIGITSYLTDLSNDIKSLSNLGVPVTININSDIKKIGLKTIVPFGLLINELLTNSIKHAFFKKEGGIININISKQEKDNFLLHYSDNGKWAEPDKIKTHFGLELIDILSSQLEGDFERTSNEEGTIYVFNIKNIDLEK